MNSDLSTKIRNAFLLLVSFACVSGAATQSGESPCPNCGCSHGIQVIEVSRTICKMVTKQEPIKKTVYEKKEIPFCEHCVAPIGHHHVCPRCNACGKTHTVLVKKSIECGKKTVHECVPEVITEQVCVPCKECGYRAHHGHLFHGVDATGTGPSVRPIAVQNTSQEPGTVELAAEPKLRDQSAALR